MRIKFVFEFDESDRRAIGHHVGGENKARRQAASREEIAAKICALVEAWRQDMHADLAAYKGVSECQCGNVTKTRGSWHDVECPLYAD